MPISVEFIPGEHESSAAFSTLTRGSLFRIKQGSPYLYMKISTGTLVTLNTGAPYSGHENSVVYPLNKGDKIILTAKGSR
jgi:hypothetical protein